MKTEYFSIYRQYEIRCKRFSPDCGPIHGAMIGVHGFAGDMESSMLKKLAAMLCLHHMALICFDFPAHGSSPVGEDMLTVENCKEDLLAVAEYVSEQYPYANKGVFATSFGGFITLLCADQLGNIPLVLRSPAVTMPKVLLENVLKVSAEDFRIKETILCGFERPIHLPYTFYENLSAQETLTSKRMTVPMLVIHGQCDDVVLLSDVQAFADTQNNIALQILPGADHRFKKPGEMETILNLTERFLCEVVPNFRLENG